MMKRVWESDEGISLRAALDWAVDGIGEHDGNYWVGLGLDAARIASVPLGTGVIYSSLKVMRVCSVMGASSSGYEKFVSGYRRR
jgi:hypothetical protein